MGCPEDCQKWPNSFNVLRRSCEPHLKAEHMAAPTNAANVKKALANSEPSTHGTKPIFRHVRYLVANGGIADMGRLALGFSPRSPP